MRQDPAFLDISSTNQLGWKVELETINKNPFDQGQTNLKVDNLHESKHTTCHKIQTYLIYNLESSNYINNPFQSQP